MNYELIVHCPFSIIKVLCFCSFCAFVNLLRCIAASAAFCTTSSVTPQSLMHEIVAKRKGAGSDSGSFSLRFKMDLNQRPPD